MKTIQRWMLMAAGLLSLAASAEDGGWFLTHRWSGEGMWMSQPFWVNGDEWIVRCRQRDRTSLKVHVCRASNEWVATVNSYRGVLGTFKEGRLHGKGFHYLQVTHPTAQWEIEVRQRLSKAEEWEYRQFLRQPPATLRRLATWHGANGRRTFAFRVPAGSWRLTYAATGQQGHIQVSLTDLAAPDSPLHQNWLDAAGRGETWIHCGGEFRFEVEAQDCPWQAEVAVMAQPPARALSRPTHRPPPPQGTPPAAAPPPAPAPATAPTEAAAPVETSLEPLDSFPAEDTEIVPLDE